MANLFRGGRQPGRFFSLFLFSRGLFDDRLDCCGHDRLFAIGTPPKEQDCRVRFSTFVFPFGLSRLVVPEQGEDHQFSREQEEQGIHETVLLIKYHRISAGTRCADKNCPSGQQQQAVVKYFSFHTFKLRFSFASTSCSKSGSALCERNPRRSQPEL